MFGHARDDQLLRQIAADVGAMRTDLATVKADVAAIKSDTDDHETRLRGLERWRYGLPASLVVSLGSAAASLVAVLHH